ncbi:sensor histidine kinase [Amycolatopsis acidicola]|uniref:histidine kinase n=1 Tax=Amycolatopsis acidicola TaxID=2596893 RepID=A0A5N0V7A8_9PSEU|nr:ATP-binding protein [Amycolatopsis acidicola]KAA9160911.1 sensor histidine kinase [Amycolatopsis acidicola]
MDGARARQAAEATGNTTPRDVLHDIGHEIVTLGYLIESILAEVALPVPVRRRALLISQQADRLRALVDDTISGVHRQEVVAVRPLLEELVTQAELAHPARVVLAPAGSLSLEVDRTALWRILSNLLTNAVHAAGPGGRVDVAITRQLPPTIEISDDGPGFDGMPARRAGRGLATVARLSRACGATTRTSAREPRGTRVEIVFTGVAAEGVEHDDDRVR